MTTVKINRIKRRITAVLNVHAHVSPSRGRGLLKIKDLIGKLYEAEVLATMIENLVTLEGLQVTLKGRGKLVLKQKGGPVNRSFPYFQVWKKGQLFGELFTDVYFNTLSSSRRPGVGTQHGDYHELDIALLLPNISHQPEPEEIMIAVECKNTAVRKSLVRELLGFRRELSFIPGHPIATAFSSWPATQINADPPSVHMLYINSNHNLSHYTANCQFFGILLIYHPM